MNEQDWKYTSIVLVLVVAWQIVFLVVVLFHGLRYTYLAEMVLLLLLFEGRCIINDRLSDYIYSYKKRLLIVRLLLILCLILVFLFVKDKFFNVLQVRVFFIGELLALMTFHELIHARYFLTNSNE